jgi:hypothetical protein
LGAFFDNALCCTHCTDPTLPWALSWLRIPLLADLVHPEDAALLGSFREYLARAETRPLLLFRLPLGFLCR